MAKKHISNEIIDSICKYIMLGATEKGASILSGVPYDTSKRWKREGSRGVAPYKEYYDAVEKAKFKRQVNLLARMQEHAKKSPQACQWLIEKFEGKLDEEENDSNRIIIYKLPDNGVPIPKADDIDDEEEADEHEASV